MQLSVLCASLCVLLVSSSRLRNSSAGALRTAVSSQKAVSNATRFASFDAYYQQHTGRGMWKWNVALEAYQRHFGRFAAQPSNILEIGVQSGGSILMYHAVLPQTKYIGMDINKNCEWFKDATSEIYIGDQANVQAWAHFFQWVVPSLDMAIDDGGHQAHQMLVTIQQVLPRMNPGGFFLTEDIHGINDDYLHKFFVPATSTIASFASLTGATLQSVHFYPFVLGVQMAPAAGQITWAPPATTAVVSTTIQDLMATLPQHAGGVVELRNPSWSSLFTADALTNFFSTFYDLYGGVVREEPAECHDGMSSTCAMIATNTPMQSMVKAVHIMQDHILVEVNAQVPSIHAIRKGSEWIPYNGP